MKSALKMVEEINRKKEALQKTESEYLRRDYSKSIKSDLRELRDYCRFRGLNLSEVLGA